jgi:recombination protein RecT
MSKEVTVVSKAQTVLKSKEFQEKLLTTMSEKKANIFKSSVLQLISSNSSFEGVPIQSVLGACMIGATLDLPLNQNLGYAYVIPYKGKNPTAQFQIGYKGFIQLAQRSGLYKTINVCKVYENDTDEDVLQRLTSIFTKKVPEGGVIGYAGYFSLLNGFEKSLYMTNEELTVHAKQYSKSFASGYGTNVWRDNFEAMASKTVLKLLLSKFGPLSTDVQTGQALQYDQSSVNLDTENLKLSDIEYTDNDGNIQDGVIEEPVDELLKFINEEAKNVTALNGVETRLETAEQKKAWFLKYIELCKLVSHLEKLSSKLDPEAEGMEEVIDAYDKKHIELIN